MRSLFLGFIRNAFPEWQDRIGPLVPPGNYKKQETIDKWMQEQWAEIEKDPAEHIVGGKVECIIAIDEDGKPVGEFGTAAFVLEVEETIKSETLRLFGFDIKELMMQTMLTEFGDINTFPYWLVRPSDRVREDYCCQLIDPWPKNVPGLSREKFLAFAPVDAVPLTRKSKKAAKAEALLVKDVAESLQYI